MPPFPFAPLSVIGGVEVSSPSGKSSFSAISASSDSIGFTTKNPTAANAKTPTVAPTPIISFFLLEPDA